MRLVVAEGSGVAVSEGALSEGALREGRAVAAGSAAGRSGAAQADSKIKTDTQHPPQDARRQPVHIHFFPSRETGSIRIRQRITHPEILSVFYRNAMEFDRIKGYIIIGYKKVYLLFVFV